MEQRTDEALNYMTEDELVILQQPPWGITFSNEDGREVGKLFFNKDGTLDFTGEATPAAHIFFTAFISQINAEWEKRYDKKQKG